ncbi:MAG: hypothetical protein RIS47_1036 [Bacteroidota bacterium]
MSQPEPKDKSPYHELAKKNNLQIDFRPFIQVEGVSGKDFRQQKITLLDFSAVIFTSRKAVDHYFRIAKELRISIPDEMKYFCINEATAYYLQKYITFRKRKIFHGNVKFEDLIPLIQKHKSEKFLLPQSDVHKDEVGNILEKSKVSFTPVTMFRTVSSDLTDLTDFNYDVLVFFSPSGIKSLFHNFPGFDQRETKIASFGAATATAVNEAGLRLDIQAPSPENPSMAMALEAYISRFNKEVIKKK